MKNVKPFFFLLLLIPLLGCEELEELLDEEFDVDVSFNRLIQIDIQPTGNPTDAVNFAEGVVINLTNAPELDEFRQNNNSTEVTAITINRIRYFYKDVAGNENAVVAANFQIPLIVAQPDTFGTPQVNLFEAGTNPNPFIIDGDFTNINSLLNDSLGFSNLELEYIGSVSDNPIEFTVDITIDVTLTLEIQV